MWSHHHALARDEFPVTISTLGLGDRIFRFLFPYLFSRMLCMSANSDALTAAVSALANAANSVATEIAALNSGDDQAAMNAATDQIKTITAQLNGLVPAPVEG